MDVGQVPLGLGVEERLGREVQAQGRIGPGLELDPLFPGVFDVREPRRQLEHDLAPGGVVRVQQELRVRALPEPGAVPARVEEAAQRPLLDIIHARWHCRSGGRQIWRPPPYTNTDVIGTTIVLYSSVDSTSG